MLIKLLFLKSNVLNNIKSFKDYFYWLACNPGVQDVIYIYIYICPILLDSFLKHPFPYTRMIFLFCRTQFCTSSPHLIIYSNFSCYCIFSFQSILLDIYTQFHRSIKNIIYYIVSLNLILFHINNE